MTDYRAQSVQLLGEDLIQEAEANGIPIPFYELAATITTPAANTTVRLQLPAEPDEERRAELVAALGVLLGDEDLNDTLQQTVVIDPREWGWTGSV